MQEEIRERALALFTGIKILINIVPEESERSVELNEMFKVSLRRSSINVNELDTENYVVDEITSQLPENIAAYLRKYMQEIEDIEISSHLWAAIKDWDVLSREPDIPLIKKLAIGMFSHSFIEAYLTGHISGLMDGIEAHGGLSTVTRVK